MPGNSKLKQNHTNTFAVSLLVQKRASITCELVLLTSPQHAIVDGPYGGRKLQQYGHAILFAQGIGIAAQMSYLKALFYGAVNGELPIRRISLIWEAFESELTFSLGLNGHILTSFQRVFNHHQAMDKSSTE